MTGGSDSPPPLKLRSRRRSRRRDPGLDESVVKLPSAAVAGRPLSLPHPEPEPVSEPEPEPEPVVEPEPEPVVESKQITASQDDSLEPIPVERVRKTPLYWRVLRLRHVHPNGWQRALLVEGVFVIAVVIVLAGKASAWTLLVLPVVAAAVVKANDLLAGALKSPEQRHGKPDA